jgi:tryptophan-rich sensory protein
MGNSRGRLEPVGDGGGVSPPRSGLGRFAAGLGFVGAVAAAGALGGSVSRPGLWYRSLRKSAATPPARVFAPVWSVLYAAMAYSAWRVWRAPSSPARTRALALWAAQLGLNAAWSPVFFRAKRPRAALLVVSILLPVLGAYVRAAWRVDKLAAVTLFPYLGWTGFATFLNRQIVRKNRLRFWT